MHIDVTHLIETGGLLAIVAIVFAESGLMVGFFLPGDTLLLSAGLFAAQGHFPIAAAIAAISLAAIAGDNTGYTIGRIMGKRLFHKKDGILFRQEYIERTEKFYEKHGPKTMLIAHFIPIVRSFAPLVAGVGKMPRGKFIMFDAIGDIAWSTAVTLLGYWFGSKIPHMDKYIMYAIAAVMLLSFGPILWHLFLDPTARKRLIAVIRRKREQDDETEQK
ncbi:MAG TPA: DedA family protein [Patescibacteria group bacterium]|nr:DedA family protein [Patescibacteria group bacterium]